MDSHTLVRSQYHATLDMIEEAIQACPEALWTDSSFKNLFWYVAYDALHYTHLYLSDSLETFVQWNPSHQDGAYQEDPLPADPDQQPNNAKPYTKDEILEFVAFCRQWVDDQVPALDLEAPSGFHWLPMNKLELQFYNIRHLQHHTGQLSERLRTSVDFGLHWVARHALDTPG
jgi:hypothetical protein